MLWIVAERSSALHVDTATRHHRTYPGVVQAVAKRIRSLYQIGLNVRARPNQQYHIDICVTRALTR